MRKKRSIAKSRAASLKGWRTKQRMQDARSMLAYNDTWAQQGAEAFIDWANNGRERPAYMRRALPNPWLNQ